MVLFRASLKSFACSVSKKFRNLVSFLMWLVITGHVLI